ncbi:hypothetical protein [Verrucomicrobium sp. BvORR034]|uniref:hypothetical protein n=1 Tax=Verrucomicrobium sp. BvORR034 TaxID=1396418 RepID=UPI000A54FD17|nr:hypothetical protein [Verrucomicrobium sp. BvORR034]
MPSRYATTELEQQAAKFRNTDQLHQSDQSLHQVEIAKVLEKGKARHESPANKGRDKKH